MRRAVTRGILVGIILMLAGSFVGAAERVYPRSSLMRREALSLGSPVEAPLWQRFAPWQAPSLDTNVRVNQDIGNMPQNETSMAVDPLNDLHLVGGANDYRIGDGDGACGFYASSDAGRTWTDGLISRTGYDGAGDPSVAISRDGTVYFACLHVVRDIHGDPQANKITVSGSRTGGVSFEPPRSVVLGSSIVDFNDKPYLTVDQTFGPFSGALYLCWTHFTSTTAAITFSRSVDGGQTWSASISVVNGGGLFFLPQTQGCSPAVGPDGTVYVAWEDFHRPDRIVIDRSFDGGQTFGADRTVATITPIDDPLHGFGWKFRTNSFPSLGVGPDGTLYVAWADQRNGDADILVSRSTDRGVTWSAPVRVNDDPMGNGRHQFFPWLAVGPDGTVHVIFYDNRLGDGTLFNLFYTRSTDKGVTWSPNQRVSSTSSSPNTPEFAGEFIGDYNGLAVSELATHPFWTDTRSGLQDVFTDRLAPRSGLSLGLGLSREILRFGEPQTLHLGAIYPPGSPAQLADLYLGFLRPDGTSLLFLSTGGMVQGTLTDLHTFVPIVTGVPLAGGIDAAFPNLGTVTFSSAEPPGPYVAFFLVTQTGALQDGPVTPDKVLGFAFKIFLLTP